MSGSDGNYQEPTKRETRELTKLRKQNERSHIDSIQILVSIGVIGWYLTVKRSSAASFSNPIDKYLFTFTILSASYIVLKINLVSIRDITTNLTVKKVERGVSFLFFAGLNGIVAVAIIDMITLRIDINQLREFILFSTAVVAIFLSVIPTVYYYRVYASIDKSIREEKLIQTIFKHPSQVETGFEPKASNWTRRNEGWLQEADIYGVDSENNEVIIEVASRATQDDINRLSRSISDSDDTRYLLAAFDFSDSVLEQIRNSSHIERCNLSINNQRSVRDFVNSIFE